MQLQVECAGTSAEQSCYICNSTFVAPQARVMLCCDQGSIYGEVCPHCIGKGFQWLSSQFEQINKPRKSVRSSWKQKLDHQLDTRLPA